MFRGDLRHSGVYETAGVPEFHGPKWTFQAISRIGSSAVVANGNVYFGSQDSNLYAIDAATGEEKWRVTLRGAVVSTPAVVGGMVIAAGAAGEIYALDEQTGQRLWVFTTATVIHSSPAVSDGIVFIGSSGNQRAVYMYAIDLLSGDLV